MHRSSIAPLRDDEPDFDPIKFPNPVGIVIRRMRPSTGLPRFDCIMRDVERFEGRAERTNEIVGVAGTRGKNETSVAVPRHLPLPLEYRTTIEVRRRTDLRHFESMLVSLTRLLERIRPRRRPRSNRVGERVPLLTTEETVDVDGSDGMREERRGMSIDV